MYLADTHVLLWWFGGIDGLGQRSRDLMRRSGAVHFSAASIVEATIKAMQGKLVIPTDLAEGMRASGCIELPIRSDHASAMADFPELLRHDPFDRILLAQAKVERMDFLTADRRLLALGHTWVLDATG